jgi:predicted anti-sigma-YlaC factor YlaD
MRCDAVREALSARMDGEEPLFVGALIDAHVGRCGGCAAWARDVRRLHRMVRVRAAEPVPDLTAAILGLTSGHRTTAS